MQSNCNGILYLSFSILLSATGETEVLKKRILPYTFKADGMKKIKFAVTKTTFGVLSKWLTTGLPNQHNFTTWPLLKT